MSDTSLNRYLGQGDDAAEAAYTPVPVTGTTPEQAVLYVNDQDPANPRIDWWDGANFVSTQGAGGGTVTNTGTLTDHALIVGNGGVDVSALGSLGTTTTVLHGNAAGDPSFGAVSLTADVSGTLPKANGGSVVVQVVNTETGAVATGTTTIPMDDTIPQNTEGTEFMTLAITPTSATNKLKIDVVFQSNYSVSPSWMIVALFQDTTAGALAAMPIFSAPNGGSGPTGEQFNFSHYMTSGTTSSTTFKVRAGGSTAGTITFNGALSARFLGGVIASSITITEIQP